MVSTRRVLVPFAAALFAIAGAVHANPVYKASMDGKQMLPEPIQTVATGAVEFVVSADGKSIAYKVSVDRLTNASAADVHLGPPSQNGPVIARLYPNGKGGKKGEYSGVLTEGRLTGADLVGPLTGAGIGDLLAELAAGNVYVNVHTNDGVEPANSGPGDFRLGEIRGQLK
ncbi:MAG TPA: CHRD domain-containing protein [Steroidobacteraceae bacterium]|nr:CHRD domain-containing protein [Steroidobacteraceae bacterium]